MVGRKHLVPPTFSRRTFWQAAALGASLWTSQGRVPRSATGPAYERTPLLDNWLFAELDDTRAPVPDRHMSTVDLPHTVAELSWRRWDPSVWERRWLYRRHFESRTDHLRHFLRFDGALTNTAVTLNGQNCPPHQGGYLPFRYEVTDLLAEQNTLDVVVDGRFDPTVPPNHGLDRPSSAVDFWQPAGLYREVTLIGVPFNHVADVFAKPVHVLDETRRSVEVRCELDLARPDHDGLRVTAELRRGDSVLASATSALPQLPPGKHTTTLNLGGLHDIDLWSTDAPHLYDVVVTLLDHEGPVHDHKVRTGFREARFERSGFYLNDQRLHLFGLNRHQFYPFAGAAMPERVQRRDAEILRNDLNCTMVRCSHYPQHESFLSACDELGLLVWDEPPGWQYLGAGEWRERAYQDVHDMIVRDRNHPSVVLWAARLNETPGNTAFYTRTQLLAKSLDDSRQTTGAIIGDDHDTLDFQQDVFGYNDYSSSTAESGPALAPPRTDFPYLVSEAVGTLTGPAKFYRRTDRQEIQQGQALAHARVHDFARSDGRYSGLLAWAGFDYPSGHGNVFDGIKWPGVVDLFRIPKPGAAIYRSQVDPHRRPVIEPSFFWDFHPTSPVTDLGGRAAVWSNLDRLELYVDGVHHSSISPARREFPHLRYPPSFADFSAVTGSPDLHIDGYLGAALVLTRFFSADRGQDRLSLALDDDVLVTGGSDATRALIRAVDTFGNDRPYVSGDVTFALDGPAALVGSNPFPLEETGGVGAVWLRSGREVGAVRLTARHPALGSATAELTAEAGGAA